MLRSAVAKANTASATKMTNDILHGLFTLEYLSSHSVCGGNASKESLDEELVEEIISKYS